MANLYALGILAVVSGHCSNPLLACLKLHSSEQQQQQEVSNIFRIFQSINPFPLFAILAGHVDNVQGGPSRNRLWQDIKLNGLAFFVLQYSVIPELGAQLGRAFDFESARSHHPSYGPVLVVSGICCVAMSTLCRLSLPGPAARPSCLFSARALWQLRHCPALSPPTCATPSLG